MSTQVLPMYSIDSRSGYEYQPGFGMPADISHLYATSEAWGTMQPTNQSTSTSTYMTFPVPSIAEHTQTAVDAFGASSQLSAPDQVYSQPKFQADNAMTYNRIVSESSPVQASFGPAETPRIDSGLDVTQHTDNGSDQTRTSLTNKPNKVGRKRKMEEADPGSERAVYLEKNRKAASKCRGKQKKQQEDLVEQAREVQQRNRCLKAEVDMLQHGLRVFMEIAGHHQKCPDSRLAIYLQREADRLAAGCGRTSTSPISPTFSVQTSFTPTIESSPEHHAASID